MSLPVDPEARKESLQAPTPPRWTARTRDVDLPAQASSAHADREVFWRSVETARAAASGPVARFSGCLSILII